MYEKVYFSERMQSITLVLYEKFHTFIAVFVFWERQLKECSVITHLRIEEIVTTCQI